MGSVQKKSKKILEQLDRPQNHMPSKSNTQAKRQWHRFLAFSDTPSPHLVHSFATMWQAQANNVRLTDMVSNLRIIPANG
jgi:hypothetical protein